MITLYSIHSRQTGALIAALDKQSVVAIHPDNDVFILNPDGAPCYVTPKGGLRKISGNREISAELKRLRRLRE